MKDLKKTLDHKDSLGGFIKSNEKPNQSLSSEEKVLLNRKANILFNEGNYQKAERIFITTGYSDGLSRIAERYKENNQDLQALKYYWLAHNKRGYEPLCKKVAYLITNIIKTED
jgi:hypothetical protein